MKETEYPKIETLFDRGEDHKVTNQLRLEEFGIPQTWDVYEKIDGTNVRIEFYWDEDGMPRLHILGRTDNAQFPTFLMTELQDVFTKEKFEEFETQTAGSEDRKGLTKIVLYGEGYGPKIQSGGDYTDKPSFRLFDVRVGKWWLNRQNVEAIAEKFSVETAPYLGPMDITEVVDFVKTGFTSKVSTIEGNGKKESEGIVARTDPVLLMRSGQRLMFKLKTRDF